MLRMVLSWPLIRGQLTMRRHTHSSFASLFPCRSGPMLHNTLSCTLYPVSAARIHIHCYDPCHFFHPLSVAMEYACNSDSPPADALDVPWTPPATDDYPQASTSAGGLDSRELVCLVDCTATSESRTSPAAYMLDSKLRIAFQDLYFHELIGKGSFKTVYRGRWNSTNVAIVCMRRGGMVTEARVLQRLSSHPNLVQFYRCAF